MRRIPNPRGYTDGFRVVRPVLLRPRALEDILRRINASIYGERPMYIIVWDGTENRFGYEHVREVYSLGSNEDEPLYFSWKTKGETDDRVSLFVSVRRGEVTATSYEPERVLKFLDEFKSALAETNINKLPPDVAFGPLQQEAREPDATAFLIQATVSNLPNREDRWSVHVAGIYGLLAALTGAAVGSWLTWKLTGH
jgi:hypothetical protein